MILPAFLLLIAQDPPVSATEDGDEIVVRATFGRTTMLFDKMADGTLRNCRIMVSSGSQRRDAEACKATPVCYEKTRDEVTDCIQLTALEQAAIAPGAVREEKPGVQSFSMPQLVKPREATTVAVGPITPADPSPDNDRQRVTKLPPAPSAPSNGVGIKLTAGDEQ